MGLLTQLGPLCRQANIYVAARGDVVGVDACVWMHQLGYAYARDIMNNDYTTLGTALRQRAQAVIGKGLNIVLVFDGGRFPAKSPTDHARAERRQVQLAKVQYDGAAPDALAKAAAQKLGWPATLACIDALRRAGVAYLVAPYEADSQLAYMASQGTIDSAWTVDSDFIVHGIKRTYFKVSWLTGRCFVVDYARLLNPQSWPKTREYDTLFLRELARFGAPFLLAYALAAGCDYGTKVPGVGPKKAVMAITLAASRGCNLSHPLLDGALPCLAVALVEFSPSLVASEWEQVASKAIVAFNYALAYDCSQKKVVSKTGMGCVEACAKWGFLGLYVPDELAEKRALGYISPDGEPCQLPDVEQVATVMLPALLTEDMIPGASLLPRPWPQGYPTLSVMHRWLRTRAGMADIGLSNARHAEVMVVVLNQLATEADMRSRGEHVQLRDPDGNCLHHILLQRFPHQGWEFEDVPAREDDLPVDDRWIVTKAELSNYAPVVELALILNHFDLVVSGAGNMQAFGGKIQDALHRVMEMPRLPRLMCHLGSTVDVTSLVGASQDSRAEHFCFFQMQAPASQRPRPYKVWAQLAVVKLEGVHPHCTRVLQASCECPAGRSAQCVHLAMLLFSVHHLPRMAEQGVNVPVTSRICKWNQPGAGETYDVKTPLSRIPFLLSSRRVIRQRGQTSARVIEANKESGDRAMYDPVSARHKDTWPTFASDARFQDAQAKLFASIAEVIGTVSALEATWGT